MHCICHCATRAPAPGRGSGHNRFAALLRQAMVVTPQCLCTRCPLDSNATVPVYTANHTISPKWHVSVTRSGTQQVAVTTASRVERHKLAVRSGKAAAALGALGITVSRSRPV